jgi:hypothetical protein
MPHGIELRPFVRAALVWIAIGSASSAAGGQAARSPGGTPDTLTGTWRTANGVLELVLTASDTLVTGTIKHRQSETITIQGGKRSNAKFTFTAIVNFQPEGFTGELRGDTLRLHQDRFPPQEVFILRRVRQPGADALTSESLVVLWHRPKPDAQDAIIVGRGRSTPVAIACGDQQ